MLGTLLGFVEGNRLGTSDLKALGFSLGQWLGRLLGVELTTYVGDLEGHTEGAPEGKIGTVG